MGNHPHKSFTMTTNKIGFHTPEATAKALRIISARIGRELNDMSYGNDEADSIGINDVFYIFLPIPDAENDNERMWLLVNQLTDERTEGTLWQCLRQLAVIPLPPVDKTKIGDWTFYHEYQGIYRWVHSDNAHVVNATPHYDNNAVMPVELVKEGDGDYIKGWTLPVPTGMKGYMAAMQEFLLSPEIANLVSHGTTTATFPEYKQYMIFIAPSETTEDLFDGKTIGEALQMVEESDPGSDEIASTTNCFSFDTEEERNAFIEGYEAAIGYLGNGLFITYDQPAK